MLFDSVATDFIWAHWHTNVGAEASSDKRTFSVLSVAQGPICLSDNATTYHGALRIRGPRTISPFPVSLSTFANPYVIIESSTKLLYWV